MEYVKLVYSGRSYNYDGGSSVGMDILSFFLTDDVGCSGRTIFRDWALADKEDPKCGFTYTAGGNATFLEEKDDGFIYLYDETESFSQMSKAKSLKVSREQLVKLLDDWQEKVCKLKPKEVLIKHENDEFIIETKS